MKNTPRTMDIDKRSCCTSDAKEMFRNLCVQLELENNGMRSFIEMIYNQAYCFRVEHHGFNEECSGYPQAGYPEEVPPMPSRVTTVT